MGGWICWVFGVERVEWTFLELKFVFVFESRSLYCEVWGDGFSIRMERSVFCAFILGELAFTSCNVCLCSVFFKEFRVLLGIFVVFVVEVIVIFYFGKCSFRIIWSGGVLRVCESDSRWGKKLSGSGEWRDRIWFKF